MARRLPTDLELLEEIYQSSVEAFSAYSEENKTRSSKIWMPIDIRALGARFGVDPDIVFGQLYYHLNHKFGHASSDGQRFEFFQIRVGRDHHCVNFPFLASVLADLREERRRFVTATGIAGLSLLVSIASIAIATMG